MHSHKRSPPFRRLVEATFICVKFSDWKLVDSNCIDGYHYVECFEGKNVLSRDCSEGFTRSVDFFALAAGDELH